MSDATSLFDKLLGIVANRPITDYGEDERTVISIMENITRVLNARAGSIKHIPDYGLPELGAIYRGMPQSTHLLRNEIDHVIRTYEPRVTAIEVEPLPTTSPGFVAAYGLVCQLRGRRELRFHNQLGSDGITHMLWRSTRDA
ncbi:type VI secretion system baseplate subunit TssE [Luteibacter sp.]|uniref:type VI secretion system baseplate subunit TssE n=1 Tax=Luteibacter sp. TaxID=1886636 RepID=UPI002F40E2CD